VIATTTFFHQCLHVINSSSIQADSRRLLSFISRWKKEAI
jgi:hypothetical protein